MGKYKKVLVITIAILALLVAAGATVAFTQVGETVGQRPVAQEPGRPPYGQRLVESVRRARHFFQARELMDAALAGELEITVDELVSARQAARLTVIQQAAGEGLISLERAELMLARAALQGYFDRDEVIAQVLGITVVELEAAREESKGFRQMATELSLDGPAIRQNMREVRESIIHQAAAEGLITGEQAELLLNAPRPLGERPRPRSRLAR